MKFLKNYFLVILLCHYMGCQTEPTKAFKTLPNEPVNHHLIVVAKKGSEVWARGFKNATPRASTIFLEVGTSHKSATSDNDGRFFIKLANREQGLGTAILTVTANAKNYQHHYEIKDLAITLPKMAGEAFSPGNDISDISLADNAKKLALLSAKASLVEFYQVNEDWIINAKKKHTVILGSPTRPAVFPISVLSFKTFSLATLSGPSELALMNELGPYPLSSQKLKASNGLLYSFNIHPPLSVEEAIDAAGDGHKTKNITKSYAHHAEALYKLDEQHFLASFTNYYQFAKPGQDSVVGPGKIALIEVKNNKLITKQINETPFKNPQYFVRADNNTVWVSCSGTWGYAQNNILAAKDGGLVKLKLAPDFNSLIIEHSIRYENFSGDRPAIVGKKIVVPKSWSNIVAVVDESAHSINDGTQYTAPQNEPFMFSFAKAWHDDIVFLGDAKLGLIAFSIKEQFFPFPFINPLNLIKEQDANAFINPTNLIFRSDVNPHERIGVDVFGFNALVVSAQEKIIPLDFLALFGP